MHNKKPVVTFIAIAFGETNEIYMFIGMLLCQKNPNWKCIIHYDGPNKWMQDVVESFKDDRIQFIQNEVTKGSWGCYNRIESLKLVDSEYVIQTTIQEYFLPITVDVLEKYKSNDFIYWPVIHHTFDYQILDSAPIRNKIDWSNFAVRTSIAKQVEIKYPDAYCADGLYVEDLMKSGLIKKQVRIERVLNIKN